jgi:hypothetical protein
MHASVTIRVIPSDVRKLDQLAKSLDFGVIETGRGISLRFSEGNPLDDGSMTTKRFYSIPEAIAYLEGVKDYIECNS